VLAFSSIGIAGTNASDFGQTNTCGSKLAVNATCQISVTFSPRQWAIEPLKYSCWTTLLAARRPFR